MFNSVALFILFLLRMWFSCCIWGLVVYLLYCYLVLLGFGFGLFVFSCLGLIVGLLFAI